MHMQRTQMELLQIRKKNENERERNANELPVIEPCKERS